VSVRTEDDGILITAAGVDKFRATWADVLWVHMDGTAYHTLGTTSAADGDAAHSAPRRERDNVRDSARRPSSELEMHLALYRRRADVHAVVHAHPRYATGWSVARRQIPSDALAEVPAAIGPIALAPYARSGTAALATALLACAADTMVWQLSNHGITVAGCDLADAVARMESVEQAAHIVAVAEQLGGRVPMVADEVRALMQQWTSSSDRSPGRSDSAAADRK
jgi:L-fuculose-phosphate aldolase